MNNIFNSQPQNNNFDPLQPVKRLGARGAIKYFWKGLASKKFLHISVTIPLCFLVFYGYDLYKRSSLVTTHTSNADMRALSTPEFRTSSVNPITQDSFPNEDNVIIKRSGVKSYIKDTSGNYRIFTIDGYVVDISPSAISLKAGDSTFQLDLAIYPVVSSAYRIDGGVVETSGISVISPGDFISYSVGSKTITIEKRQHATK